MLYIVETKFRKNTILGILDRVHQLYCKKMGVGVSKSPIEIGLPFLHYQGEKRLAILTFQDYINGELLKPENLDYIFLETSHLGKMLSCGMEDYVTDTYVRRAQIECYKLLQAYKNKPKIIE